MTIAELINETVAALPTNKQRKVLALARKLRPSDSSPEKPSRPSKKRIREVDRALLAVAGMWKDRTDLPRDSAAASKLLRRRLMGRKQDA
ncbi:MAG TPA: hypothetical protein VH253_04290 [Phycisphaerae bacterium]|nr:hypothetical protein [Phycisphaerae bacterium]